MYSSEIERLLGASRAYYDVCQRVNRALAAHEAPEILAARAQEEDMALADLYTAIVQYASWEKVNADANK